MNIYQMKTVPWLIVLWVVKTYSDVEGRPIYLHIHMVS